MIASLKGKLQSSGPEALVLDVKGVGYEVFATNSARRLAPSLGAEIQLIIYTDVRENAISLFGFSSSLEKETFLLLKKVKGIGSRLALAIVSSMGPEGLLVGIGQQDVKTLQQIPGIGKKTAERIIVELREQVGQLAYAGEAPLSASVEKILVAENEEIVQSLGSTTAADAVLALEKLGFSLEKAKLAVQKALEKESAQNPEITADAGELVRAALGNL